MPRHAIDQNGIQIVRTMKGVGVGIDGRLCPSVPAKLLTVEVDYQGRRLNTYERSTLGGFPFRDYFGRLVNHLECIVRVKDGAWVMAELGPSHIDPMHAYMVRTGEQHHITESSVSIPPALHITDELGAVWTLGLATAPKELSPEGEFAFDVLRDGVSLDEIASRIERRNGKIRVFTRRGWKGWTGREFV